MKLISTYQIAGVVVFLTAGLGLTKQPLPARTQESNSTPDRDAAIRANGNGWSQYGKGENAKAGAAFDEAIRLDATFAPAYVGRAALAMARGQNDRAIADCNQALKLDPNLAIAYNARGNAYLGKRNYDKAIADYDEAVRLAPQFALAFSNRGWVHYSKRDFDKAITDYNEAIRLDPRSAGAYNRRGISYVAKREYDKALSDYGEAIRINPEIPFFYHNRGLVYRIKGDYEKVIDEEGETIRLDPKYAPAYVNRGEAYLQKRQYDRAILDTAEAIRLNPKDFEAKQQRYTERDRCREVIKELRTSGELGKVITATETLLAAERQAVGEGADVAQSLKFLAELHEAQEQFTPARKARQELLDMMIKLHGKEAYQVKDARQQLAASVASLAEWQEAQADFAAARKSRQEALAMLVELYGEHEWRVTDARQALAHLEAVAALDDAQRNRLAEAQRLVEESKRFQRQENYGGALRTARQALGIHKEVLGEDGPEYAQAITALADVYKVKGDDDRAEPLYRQAAEIRKKTLGEWHPAYGDSLNDLAKLYSSLGDTSRAKPLFQQFREIREKAGLASPGAEAEPKRTEVTGEAESDYAGQLHKLAAMYAEQGDYAKAEPLYRQCLELRKQASGEKTALYAALLNELAALCVDMGDYTQAELLYCQALDVRQQVLGKNHPDYAATLHNLGLLYEKTGRASEAERMLLQDLEITKKALGENDPDYAHSLASLAFVYTRTAEYAKAEPLYRQALEILKKQQEKEQASYARALNNLGFLYREMGQYAKAEPLLLQARTLRAKVLGEQHPAYADSLLDLAGLYDAMGDYPKAVQLLRDALRITRNNQELASVVQSERQQLAMTTALRGQLDLLLSLAPRAKLPAEELYGEMLTWKGSVFARRQRYQMQRQDPNLANLLKELRQTSTELATLAFDAPDAKGFEDWERQIQNLTGQKERLEAQVTRRSAEFRDRQPVEQPTPAQVQAALPPGSLLLDFLEYTYSNPPPAEKGKAQTERHLVVFVIGPGLPIVMRDLGPLQEVAEAIDQWRSAVGPGTPAQGIAAKLRRLVWEPIQPDSKDVKTVLVSPDGVLCRLPFAALPGSKPDHYLIEEYAFATVPVPQVLPRLFPQPGGPADAGAEGKGHEASLLLVGDVDFGTVPASGGDSAARQPAALSRATGFKVYFSPLPATRGEVLSVRDSFEQQHPDGWTKILRGSAATKEAVRQQLQKNVWLHLATHGFFAPPEVRSALGSASKRAGRGATSDRENEPLDNQGISGFNPGLLSGLALASANERPKAGQEDGILTALEVADLDLGRVELATLSACETGLGEVAGGEGILGLQRAFQVAGAHSVVASLWKIDDKATRELMERFYENLWQNKLPKLEALRQAQLWMLNEGHKRGMVLLDEEDESHKQTATPPYYWAGFVLSGDWR